MFLAGESLTIGIELGFQSDRVFKFHAINSNQVNGQAMGIGTESSGGNSGFNSAIATTVKRSFIGESGNLPSINQDIGSETTGIYMLDASVVDVEYQGQQITRLNGRICPQIISINQIIGITVFLDNALKAQISVTGSANCFPGEPITRFCVGLGIINITHVDERK